jgi:hypothetical protein
MRTRTRFLAVAAVALFAAQARAQEDLGETSKLDASRLTVSLSEVTSFPEAYRRIPFDLELLFHGPRDIYNPYYTLFEPANYLNFAAWTADQPIWNRDAYVGDYALFYVDRKNSALEHAMVSMKPYTWFKARCIVKSTAQGHAWIEVLSVVSVAATFDKADLRHLVRANVLASGGEFDRALLEFGMAKMIGAPAKFVARYHADEGRTALDANQPGRALAELSTALADLPDDKDLIALLDRASGTLHGDHQQQVASVPTNVPPPLNLNGNAPAPKSLEPKPLEPKPLAVEPKPAVAKPAAAKPSDAKAPVDSAKPAPTATGIDPIAPTTEAPKSEPSKVDAPKVAAPKADVPKVDAPKAKASDATKTTDATKVDATKTAAPNAEPTKVETPKTEVPKTEAPKSDPTPAAEPKVDPTPAPKAEPAVPPKGDEGKVPAEKPAEKKEPVPDQGAPKDGDKPEEKKEVPPAPDAPKEGDPAPDAPKDGDKPEEKKEGDPAPDAPKPEGKPDEGKPEVKPADKPADKPDEKPANEPKSGGN